VRRDSCGGTLVTALESRGMTATYDPDLYDIATPQTFGGDVDWYRRKAREAGGPVLELGAGTGRITIPIAQDGTSVWALDADTRMLDALRRKVAALPTDVRTRVTIVEGDMQRFALETRFALVISPFRAFLHNLTHEDQLACARRVYDHLLPGGRFAFNIFHPSLEYMARNAGALAGVWRLTETHTLPGGGLLVRSEANQYDTVQRRVRSLHRYEQYNPDRNLTRTFLHRLELAYLYPSDVRALLKEAGFSKVEIHGDFHGRALENDLDEQVIEADRN
jgi:SAM-dependent methyltransferase